MNEEDVHTGASEATIKDGRKTPPTPAQLREAKEKALKLEYGKIPGPGAGGSTEDKEMAAALELAKELGENRAKNTSSVRDQLKGLVR